MCKDEAIKRLKQWIRPSNIIYVVLRHVSTSGMSRRLDFYVIKHNQPIRITYLIAYALGYRLSKVDDALVVQGCGMDMGFSVVYSLGRCLFPKGGSLRHTNSIRRLQEKKYGREKDGGYLLKHQWL